MATLQSTIKFPARKRFSCRSYKNKVDKENTDVSPTKETCVSKCSPVKRSSDPALLDNGASPTKSKRILDSTVPPENISTTQVCKENAQTLSSEPEDTSSTGDGLSKAIRVLHSSQPVRLYGREDKIEKIMFILQEALENKKSTTLYISGPPGTGKTACVNHILNQPRMKGQFKSAYVNCTGLKSAGAAYRKIAEELGLKHQSTEKKTLLSIEKYLSSSNKMTMLVLDEMDQLESKKQAVLYTIFEWPSVYKDRLVLLGIANALDLTDRVLPRLQAKLELLPQLFYFPSYTKEEILSILTNRLTEAGVDEVLSGGALQLLASKVAAVSGDIRKALDIGRRVIEITQTKSGNGEKVSLLDVLSVVNNVYGTSITLDNSEAGESFPLHQRILICTFVLIKKNSKVKEVTIGRLHDVYKKVCSKRNLPALDISEFISLTELVESRGAIRIMGKNKNRLSKILLLWDETEIATALQDRQFIASILDDISCLK